MDQKKDKKDENVQSLIAKLREGSSRYIKSLGPKARDVLAKKAKGWTIAKRLDIPKVWKHELEVWQAAVDNFSIAMLSRALGGQFWIYRGDKDYKIHGHTEIGDGEYIAKFIYQPPIKKGDIGHYHAVIDSKIATYFEKNTKVKLPADNTRKYQQETFKVSIVCTLTGVDAGEAVFYLDENDGDLIKAAEEIWEESEESKKNAKDTAKFFYRVLAWEDELRSFPDDPESEKKKQKIFTVSHENIRLDVSHTAVFRSLHRVMSLFGALTMILIIFWWWTPTLPYYVDQGMPYAFIGWTALFFLLMAYSLRKGMDLKIVLVRLYSIIFEDILMFWIAVAVFPFSFFLWTLCFRPMYKIQFEDQGKIDERKKKYLYSFWNFTTFHMRVCKVFRQFCLVLAMPYFWLYKLFSYCIMYCKREIEEDCCQSCVCLWSHSVFYEFEQHLTVIFLDGEPLWRPVDEEEEKHLEREFLGDKHDRELARIGNMRNKYGLSATLMFLAQHKGIRQWLKMGLTGGVILKTTSHLFNTQNAGIDDKFVILIQYSWVFFWIIVYLASFWALMSFELLTKQGTVLEMCLEEYEFYHKYTIKKKKAEADIYAKNTYPFNVMNFIDFDETWTNVILRFSVTSWLFCIFYVFADRNRNEEGRSGTWERLQDAEQISTFSLYIVMAPAIFFSWAPVLIVVSEAIYDYCKYLKYTLLDQHTPHNLWAHVAVVDGIARFRVDSEAGMEEDEKGSLEKAWDNFGSNWQINHGLISKLNKLISRHLMMMFILVILGSVIAVMQLIAVIFGIDWYKDKLRYGYSASTILLWSSLLLLTTVYKMQLVNQIRQTSMEELKQNLIEEYKHSHLALQSFEDVIETFQNKFPIVAMVGRVQMRGFEYHFLQVLALLTTFGWVSRLAYMYHQM